MTVVPAEIPVTTPEELMVPTAGLLLLHVPPGVAELNVVVSPIQTSSVPVIGSGNGLTVRVFITIQSVPKPYVMLVVPADSVVTNPVVKPIVATLGLPLIHVPPKTASVHVVVCPTHSTPVPIMGSGVGSKVTITMAVSLQPCPSVTTSVYEPATGGTRIGLGDEDVKPEGPNHE